MKNKKFILIICVFLLTLIPILQTYIGTKGQWQGVVPSFVDDDLYYYGRMQNIVHGYPLIGNPYFFEHRTEISPAFFVSDWFSVLPMEFGLTFIQTVIFNFIFWSILFSILVYYLFREYNLSESVSFVGALLTYSISYTLIMRPVAMQIVAPFFLLFCLAYAKWLKSENISKWQNIFLTLTVALSFYIYTYLWQIVFVVLGLTFIYLFYIKNWYKLKNLLVVGLGGFVLSLPIFIYTFNQISSPNYWDSMYRIGLVNTHLPTALSFYDSLFIFIILGLWTISFRWLENFKNDLDCKDSFIFIFLTGLGLVVTLFSNLVTGKELEISNHIERFVIVWVPISFILYVWFFIKFSHQFYKLSYHKKSIISIFIVISFIISFYFFNHGFHLVSIVKTDVVSPQVYAQPLNWIFYNAPKESVIWNNGSIGYYLPIMTTDFQLFNPLGGLHLVSSKEVEERYLVSHYFDNLTLQDIEKDFRMYAGVGNSTHQYKTFNRQVKICQIMLFSFLGVDCGEVTTDISFKGQKYFIDLYDQYTKNIKPNILDELKKFKVKFILKDKRIFDNFNPEKIPNTKLVWSNQDFEIYSIIYK